MSQISRTYSQPAAVDSVEHYGTGAIVFHWATFVLFVVVGVLGLLHDSWPDRTQAFWINLHAVIGIFLWLLVLARMWWRTRHAPPALPANLGARARQLSRSVHLLLYGLLLITPVIGFITFVHHGRVLDFGIVEIEIGVQKNPAISHSAENIHGSLACAIFALAGLHTLAALWHQFRLRDGVLGRMWPGTNVRR
jgi:cytochrome b561